MTYIPKQETVEIAGELVAKTTDQLMHDLLVEILFEIRQVRLHLQEITNERFDQ